MASIQNGTIFLQGEALDILGGGGPASVARTQDANQERDGRNGLGADIAGPGDTNPGAPDFNDYGLRPDYTGDGYLDINGDAGEKLAFEFEAAPGTYEVTLRLANGSTGTATKDLRPVFLRTDAGDTASQPTKTTAWYDWRLRTYTIEVPDTDGTGGVQSHRVTIHTEIGNGPNIDALAIALQGTAVSFLAPTIDADTFAVAENTTDIGQVPATDLDGQSLAFSISGGADATLFAISAEGVLSFVDAPDFDVPGSVAGTNAYAVEVTATDGADAVVRALTINVEDVDDEPVTAIELTAVDVAENVAGAVVATVAVADADTTYGAGDVTILGDDAEQFEIAEDGVGGLVLKLRADSVLNFEAAQPSVTLVVTGVGSAPFTPAPTNDPSDDVAVNTAPTALDGTAATTAGLEVAFDIADLIDDAEDAGEPTILSATSADGAVSIAGTTLTFAPADGFSGAAQIAYTVSDSEGLEASATVDVTVDAAPVPFMPVTVQAETGVIALAKAVDNNSTALRDPDNREPNGNLREGYSGTGYVDYGNDAGDSLTLTVTVAEAGTYDLNVRYASNSVRPLDLAINDVAQAGLAFAPTDPDGTGPKEGFDHWAFETRTVTLAAGDNTIALVIPAGAKTGPNIDRIEITEAGTGPLPDITADEDGRLTATASAEVAATDLGAVAVTLNSVDTDVTGYEVSTDGGATFVTVAATEAVPAKSGDKVVTLDLSAFAGADSVSAILRLTDAAGNTVDRTVSLEVDSAPEATSGMASMQAGEAVVIALADLIADAEDGEPAIVSATSPDGTVTIDDAARTLTFTPAGGFSGTATISYVVRDAAGQDASAEIAVDVASQVVPTIALVAVAFDENVAGAVVADIVVTDASPDADDIDLGGNTAYRVIGTQGALQLALAEGTAADFEGAALLPVTVAFGAAASEGFVPAAQDADDAAVVTLTPVAFDENVEGAVVAEISVTDQDGDLYGAADLSVDDGRFEIVDADGLKLRLRDGQSLDAEGTLPTLTVSVGGGSAQIVPAPADVAEPRVITFDGAITGLGNQDRPDQGGSVTAAGGTITLDGNFWKRVAIDAVDITATSVLRVTIANPVQSEIVAIGFDADGDAFDGDRNVYQLAGSQSFGPLVDLRGTGTVNADGSLTFEIPLDAQAGQRFESIVLINDDDSFRDGRGKVTFSGVEVFEVEVDTGNAAPHVVGGGIADQVLSERGTLEIDLPFVDDDGDALTYSFAATLDGAAVALPLTLSDGVLSGDLGDTPPGVYTVTVLADDGQGGVTPDTFVLKVENVNDAPVADPDAAFEPYFGAVGQAIVPIDLNDFAGAFSDADGDALEYVVTGLAAGLRVEEGVIFGTPTGAGDGTFSVAVRDPDGATSAAIEIGLLLDAPGVGDVIVVEAEAFTGLSEAVNFFATGQAGASGDRLIRANGGRDSSVISVLSQNGVTEGWYKVQIDVYDENDGTAPYALRVGDVLLSDVGATFDDAGTFLNGGPRGGAGQAGNLKRIDFETVVFVDADTVLELSGRANGELLRTDRVIFTRVEQPNATPGDVTLTGEAVAENTAGATLGLLSAVDPDGDDAAIVFSVDPASIFEVSGDMLKLKDGTSLDFEAGATVTVDVTATDAAGAATTTTLTVAVADVDEAPGAPVLAAGAIDENVTGAVIGQLSAADPEAGTITFTTIDPRFVVDGAGVLTLKDGVALDFEAGGTVTVAVTADDGTNRTTGDVTFDVTDANEAPVLTDGAALADVALAFGAGGRVDVAAALGPVDEDGDVVSYGLRAADGAVLPAGITIDGTDLVLGDDLPAGTYKVEVFATDGSLESNAVPLTVTVGEPAPFEPFVVQGEAAVITASANPDGDATTTIHRDQDDDSEDETPGTDKILENGLRAGYSGNGYIDFGDDPGDTASFVVTVAVAGTYDVNVRYSSQDQANGPRVLDFGVNGGAAVRTEFPDTGDTNATGAAALGFNNWGFVTRTVTLAAGENVVTLAMAAGTNAGPNVDRIEVTAAGTGPIPASDTSADADAFPLDLDGPTEGSTLNATQAASINFTVTGEDDDIVKVELSFDGGATRTDVTAIIDADGDFVFDGSTLPAGATTATIIVTDAAGNEASDDLAFVIGAPVVSADPIVIQAEDETLVTVNDTGTGPLDRSFTRIVDAENPDAFGNFRAGAEGGAYVDFGTDAGDAITVVVDAPVAGTYSVTIRYANGSGETRPLAISVDGGTASNVAFASTGAGDAGWEAWTEITLDLDLAAGANSVKLAIPTVADGGRPNGPNIDSITFTPPTDDTGGERGEQRFEDVIRVNFEAPTSGNGSFNAPADYVTPAGYESDTGAAFGDRGNGFRYGWVDVENDAVTDVARAQPTGSARYKNDVPGASDLQKTYLHFEYPGAGAADRERAWEIEVENGTYELTLSIGDTGGKYDSDYVVNVEGQRFGNAFTPVALDGVDYGNAGAPAYDASFDGQGFRSSLQTAIVQVTDGRLTIDSIGGNNTEIQFLDLQRIPDLTPDDGRSADLDYSKFVAAVAASNENGQVSIEVGADGRAPLDIDPTSSFVIGVELQAIDHRGPSIAHVEGVRLIETLTGVEVAINVQITGGADGMTVRPLQDLKEFTSYTLLVEDVLDLGNLTDSDAPQRQFQDYTTTFVTGEAPELEAREVAFTDQIVLNGFAEGGVAFTSIEFGPDGKLYTSSITGDINRWDVNPDGTIDVSSNETLSLGYFKDGGRSIIGFAFDPEDANVIWVTDNAPVPREGKAEQTPDFSGQVSKITLGDGGAFDGAVAETYITGLPRSGGDHVTNSIEFRANPDAGVDGAPNFLLYFTQGSNSAAGRPDNSWGFRPERLLNAAVLEVDPRKDAPPGGFDVQTEPYDPATNVPTYRTGDAFEDNGTFAGFYDPFAADAVLKIYGEGIRNGYDLVWHSNGNLYVPTNGTARGGNTLDDPETVINEELSGLDKQNDFLFQVKEGGYYGHPNELLEHYVVNGGAGGAPNIYGSNNSANTSDGGREYATGVQRDADYDADGSYSLGFNKSPNGATEYTGNAFGSNLKGAVLFVQFSTGDNVRVINVDPVTGRVTGDDVLRRPDGSVIDNYIDPLDIIENPLTGQLYMMTLNRGSGESQIVLLNPAPGGVVADVTADAGGDLALTVIDATDPSAVIFAVAGLDADIEEVEVSFDGGAAHTVTLDAQNRFAFDLSGRTGAVNATLTVRDEVPNTASSSTAFTLGEAGEPDATQFIDATQFRILSDLTGTAATVIRRLDDPSTHEAANSGNDVAPKDGLNDGYDGAGYLDPNGGAEDKAEFDVTVDAPGTYTFVFRMAANNSRPVEIQVGDQAVGIDVNTTTFTNWTDYSIVLTLEAGLNTVTIVQTGATGPNVDSVTVTPLDVIVPDTTADEGGDLAVALLDDADRANTVFSVTGLDDDIETVSVSFDGGATLRTVAVTNGLFTADTTGLSGAVTVTLIVADAAANTATATAAISLTDGDDGTAVIDGVTYVLYEAERAALDGAAIVGDDAGEDGRGAEGAAFVDFVGTADQTISWTVVVAEDGTYGVDILYALGLSQGVPKADRPMAISVDGTVVEKTLPFASNSNADETLWAPQSTSLVLTTGSHTITVTAPGGNGPNVDQLRITQGPIPVAPDTTADEGGDLAVTLADATDRAATLFDVAGLDDDIVSVSVSFDGGTTTQAVTVTNGRFAVDTTALSGALTVTLAVADGATNTASATTGVTFEQFVANDGTTVIGGTTYVLYEAENAAFTGPEIIGDDAGEDGRGAEGGAFVDFNGTADQTVTWTVSVAEDGTYALDILYALGLSGGAPKADRPMVLAVDGASVETLPFASNSNAGETIWGPQNASVALTAGVHTISVTAPGGNGPNIDQLRISQAPVAPIEPRDPNADIEVRSLDPAYFDDRLHFSWLDDDSARNDDRQFKENAFVELSNSGTNPLEFRSSQITGPFELADPSILDGLVLQAGEKITVEVLFDRSAYTSGPSSVTGVFEGRLDIRTNDEDTPVATVDLAGFWQARDEGGWEPNINEVWKVFGFGNVIEGLSLTGGGEESVLDFYDLYLPSDETEVLSPYWRLADGVTEATITQIAAYHGNGGAALGIHAPGSKGQEIVFSNHAGDMNQTILPLLANGGFASATFNGARIPNGWAGDDIFGFKMAGLSTDPTLNPSGNGDVTQAQLSARYPGYTVTGSGNDKTVFDPQGNVVPEGYTVRMFQAVDANGVAIQNVYLGVMDYTGINYDYNDNMFIVEGVAPVGNGATLAVSGLDDVAADDRLVFSSIDSPRPGQETRDSATFTVENDGTGALKIQSLGVEGAFTVTGLAVGDSIPAGGSAQVTVTFTGTDGTNDNRAVLFEGGLTIGTNVGSTTVSLAGLAQFEGENGEEPDVAQIAEAFGYGTDMALGQLANGGRVEVVGDEVLLPYLEALDGTRPVEVIQIAAYLNQGNVARLSLHGLDSSDLTQLFAADDNQGQTLLPDGLVPGTGDTGGVARASFAPTGGFGLKVTVDGRPTYASWTDPEANRIDPDFGNLVGDDRGHLIRFFQAKDASGAVIEGTFIAIQDYPGAGNYDYNDHMFVIRNVQAHALTPAEDANGNGVNDALETDADGDGKVAFFDADDAPVVAPEQTAFNAAKTPWAVDADGLKLTANLFDNGGQGVAYNDDGTKSGDLSVRPGENVDISNGTGAIGYTNAGEWLEYTIEVAAAGDYTLVFDSSSPSSGRALTATFAQGGGVYETATAAIPNTGAYTTYRDSAAVTVTLQAGVQVLRVNFDLNQQDLRSFTLAPVEVPNTAPVAGALTDQSATEGTAFSYDAGAMFSDADGDDLVFTASGLPAGLTISADGIISGTLPLVAADTAFAVTVTASDGEASVSGGFTLAVADVAPPPAPGQTPFPGPNAPAFVDGVLVVDASNYDEGGQGVAYNDAAGLQGGSNGGRAGSSVEQTAAGDIGWIASGEWLEYTIDVAEAGLYDLDLLLATSPSGRSASVDFYRPGADTPYVGTGSIANPSTGSYTNFQARSADGIALEAGTQVVRITFAGGSQDIRSFTLTQAEVPNTAPVASELADQSGTEGSAFTFDAGAAFFDADDDDLVFTSSGLPSGLTISAEGVISGTLPLVTSDTTFDVTVTASDGQASVSEGFTLAVADVAPPTPTQTPFPAGGAPVIGADAVTIAAKTFDNGGQGISWNDDPGRTGGGRSSRADTDVELVGATEDIGYVRNGEWVEYTVNVAEAGDYALSVNAKTPIGGNGVTVSLGDGPALARFALTDSNGASTGFGDTTFGQTAAQTIRLEAGAQTLRVAFDGVAASNGYLLDYRGLTLDRAEPPALDAIGESGRVTITQSGPGEWFTVTFAERLDDPSVVMGPITNNDGEAATVRVRAVTDTGFQFQIDEWDYLDGAHGTESIGWLAVEAGEHRIGGQTIVAGKGLATGNDSALSFGSAAFSANPVVMAQVASINDGRGVTAQLNSVSKTGFTLDLDHEEAAKGLHGTETVSWIAVSSGGTAADGLIAGLKSKVTHNGSTISFGSAFDSGDDFVFLADMQSEKGSDAADLRLTNLTASSASIFVQEEQSRDAEVRHTGELVGYLAVETGLLYEDNLFV